MAFLWRWLKGRRREPPFAIIGHLHDLPTIIDVWPEESDNHTLIEGQFNIRRITKAAAEFIGETCKTSATGMESEIQKFMEVTHQDYLTKTASTISAPVGASLVVLVMGRVSKYNQTPLPQWHVDPTVYIPENEGEACNFYATTLHGYPTMVLAEHGFTRKFRLRGFAPIPSHSDSDSVPNAKFLQPIETGDIIRFTSGQPDSPLHASGFRYDDQVFLRICYGSEAQIRQHCDNWNRKYRG
ncbi:uncharacterized protein BP5553_04936 [Venustampulla echinocandica]|uniref:Phytanoyl-CoA dioxygenase family protein n=1 Tax=Venustampulla echinocandica TaxID=2656787 RepID=A0A370TPQ3_9HELO|nr:uncharacterized protein BP5553_04936 [Venustampulla echinocandica]RDL37503.1 hypothetical protein BP5553_04936 [Venustampulla echinocandica]